MLKTRTCGPGAAEGNSDEPSRAFPLPVPGRSLRSSRRRKPGRTKYNRYLGGNYLRPDRGGDAERASHSIQQDTGQQRSTLTNDEGAFVLRSLPIGQYHVT